MTVDEEVRAFNDAFERALAEQDADALIAMYRDDARLMIEGRPVIQGRPGIEKVMRAWVKDGPVSTRFETEEVLASGELVIDIGHIIQAEARSKYVVIHRRAPDGSLRIAVDAPSSNGEKSVSVDPATLRRFAEDYTAAWCSMDPERVAQHFAPNGSLSINGAVPAIGREAITATARGFYTALPDMQVYFNDLVIGGARIEYHWTFTGTNTGPGGTGKAVRMVGHEEWTIDDNRLIAASSGHYDADEYARQLANGV